MTEKKNIELLSEEVQEIMGTPPKWIVRRGIFIITIVVCVLIAGSYFYKYPDIIKARVTILSENPPISIVARSEGKLDKIFVEDNQTVSANTILGIIENPADYKDVYALINVLNSIQDFFDSPDKFNDLSFDREYSLGHYHAYFSTFVSQLIDYQTYLNYNPYDQRIESFKKQIVDYRNYLDKSREQIAVLRQDYELANSQYYRDSALNANQVMSDVELEESKAGMLKQKFAYKNAMTSLASTQITLNNLNSQINEQEVLKQEAGKKLLGGLMEKFDNLINQLRAWEQAYILKTPVEGKVTFTNFWSVNQFVSSGNVVFTVVPDENQDIIGKAVLPVVGAGKVQTNQQVNIKLDNFPYMEYGILEGHVLHVSAVPVTTEEGSFYIAEIEVPDDMITNYKIELPVNQEMQGIAEIITKDRRLIERLIDPLVSVFRERL